MRTLNLPETRTQFRCPPGPVKTLSKRLKCPITSSAKRWLRTGVSSWVAALILLLGVRLG